MVQGAGPATLAVAFLSQLALLYVFGGRTAPAVPAPGPAPAPDPATCPECPVGWTILEVLGICCLTSLATLVVTGVAACGCWCYFFSGLLAGRAVEEVLDRDLVLRDGNGAGAEQQRSECSRSPTTADAW